MNKTSYFALQARETFSAKDLLSKPGGKGKMATEAQKFFRVSKK